MMFLKSVALIYLCLHVFSKSLITVHVCRLTNWHSCMTSIWELAVSATLEPVRCFFIFLHRLSRIIWMYFESKLFDYNLRTFWANFNFCFSCTIFLHLVWCCIFLVKFTMLKHFLTFQIVSVFVFQWFVGPVSFYILQKRFSCFGAKLFGFIFFFYNLRLISMQFFSKVINYQKSSVNKKYIYIYIYERVIPLLEIGSSQLLHHKLNLLPLSKKNLFHYMAMQTLNQISNLF